MDQVQVQEQVAETRSAFSSGFLSFRFFFYARTNCASIHRRPETHHCAIRAKPAALALQAESGVIGCAAGGRQG